eukprot:TRINITY_DN22556_c0_g1_i1.p1 TRINITY_DN22556_c0_g1~~TRINITY_DN22556_c0_g1_i1.p1  ORF type:complete len:297 (-),score=88.91 TRINITY_DN22556_c0_g1_i1:46-936(-)
MSVKNIAIIGASGNVGQAVVNAINEQPKIFDSITILTATSSDDPKWESHKAKGYKIVQVNLDDKANLTQSLKGVDLVLSTVGNALFAKQPFYIDAAIDAGVKWFVPSEFGSDLEVNANEPVFGHKVATDKHLKSVQDKISHVNIYTGPFAGWGLSNGFLGFDVKNHSYTLYDDGKQKSTFTDLPDVGRFAVAIIKNPEPFKNRAARVAGFTATQLEIVDALEKKSGQKFEVKDRVNTKELKASALEALQKGDFGKFAVSNLQSLIWNGQGQFDPIDNAKLPEVKALNLEQTVAHVL